MTHLRRLAVAAATAALFTTAVGPVQALVQSWDPNLVAYSYVYYADAEKTEVLGYAWDTCGQSGSHIYVTRPYIPTAYYDQTPTFVCAELGPYLPPDWPY